MSRRRKKKAPKATRRGSAAERQALKVFELVPASAQSGVVYYEMLRAHGVHEREAKAIAGTWMLERSSAKP